ncbi:transcription antitermination factor NusB [Collinsella sp. zg1085]|uniref:transcription antitermination factor NusB n=1 Tax=Collinsella sp. zg1085 TaxID=2844380 RepID=UPI001C0CB1F6|nr:transcription antitermination factor NusB [Collinsella sp. zg1085]QWT17079.1 transcription antitermination factor NusB [Collinsella sp. zg1085]
MASHRVERGRSKARSQALQLMFQAEAQQLSVEKVLDGDYLLSTGPLEAYAETLARGCWEARVRIDAALRAVSENWTLERMPGADRNLLRLAVYELRFLENADRLDDAVVINEAVELAKAYGTDESSRFVNGILGKVAGAIQLEDLWHADAVDEATPLNKDDIHE